MSELRAIHRVRETTRWGPTGPGVARIKPSRSPTWPGLRVYFAILLMTLFALGAALVYASFLPDPRTDYRGTDFRTLGVELMALAVIAGGVALVLKNRLSRDI
jgi:hypothetical protein